MRDPESLLNQILTYLNEAKDTLDMLYSVKLPHGLSKLPTELSPYGGFINVIYRSIEDAIKCAEEDIHG